MKFFATAAILLASAAAAVANTVTFITEDDNSRTIYFTPSPGHAWLDSVAVSPGSTEEVSFPHGWIGNWYAVIDGEENVPGMLGEVTFNGWQGLTYYDVSAIVNPNDVHNVHWMYPVGHEDHRANSDIWSGCTTFPCDTCYNLPDDVQTKTTRLTDLVCTLGSQ